MRLLVLAYHRGHPGVDGNSPEMLDAHFEHIASGYANVLPGDPLPEDRHAVCLCFDGAFFDFYTTVFPLLEKHGLRAVLAVTPSVIREEVQSYTAERQRLASADAYAKPLAGGFCTWFELEDLVRTGRLAVAAHGYTHCPLHQPEADFETEVHVPRTLIAARLRTTVESFVFPFGKTSRAGVEEAKTAYRYVFGNGNAGNRQWDDWLLHRIDADNLRTPTEPFEPVRLLQYRVRRMWHRLRPC